MTEVFATRKIARRVAHARMKKAGVVHPNKRRYVLKHKQTWRVPSYFAQNWRAWSV